MKHAVPTLTAALIGLALFACAQPATPPPPHKFATVREPTVFPSCTDRNVVDGQGNPQGDKFVNSRVFLLQDNFDPYTSSPYKAPAGPAGVTKTPYAADLIAAFNIAPRFFQEQLCGLDGVFVNLKPCNDPANCAPDAADSSWGYRETLDQNPQEPAGRFIAISALLWRGGPHVEKFYDFETELLQELFRRPYGVSWDGPQYGDGAGHAENSPAMTVLASLAHEFGHVLWRDKFRPVRSDDMWDNDFSKFCSGGFFAGSWQPFTVDGTLRQVDAPPPWRGFGDRSGQPHQGSDVQIDSIDRLIWLNAQYDTSNSRAVYLDRIYNGGSWASFFAAISPDEDFVETFKFYVLTNATPPLKHLPITIPSVPSVWFPGVRPPPSFNEDIPANYHNNSNQILANKVKCFSAKYYQR